MKILLVGINAKYIHSNPAVYSLKACAGEWEDSVEVAEYTINHPFDQIRADIYRRKPEVVAFSCYIWNITYVEALVWDLQKLLPDAEIWLGGPEVSYDAARVLDRLPVKGVMTGPGEASFQELVRSYGEEQSFADRTILAEPPVPLDKIPFLYQEIEDFENRIIYYESSRGCPFSCSYCLSSIDRSLDFRSIRRVKEELDFFLARKVPQVKFVDRTFNCKPDHAKGIWQHIADYDNGITNFHFEVAADGLDEEMLQILRTMRPGAIQLEIGVQSTCVQTLGEIRRSMDFEKVTQVVREINSWHNIHQHLDLIAGLPYEDYDRFGISFNQVYALEPEQLQLGFLKVLKGSHMAQKAGEYELLYSDRPPYEVLATKWMGYEDLLRLKRMEEVLELYYNSGQFTHTLKRLVSRFPSPFAFYETLAEYYDKHRLFGIQSSRVRKYEILLDFALEREKQAEGLCRELLTYDLYLREHVKNRPALAKPQEEYRERITDWMAAGQGILAGYEDCSYRDLQKAVHVEVFTEIFDRPSLVLFDYQKRDPLTRNVEIRRYEEF